MSSVWLHVRFPQALVAEVLNRVIMSGTDMTTGGVWCRIIFHRQPLDQRLKVRLMCASLSADNYFGPWILPVGFDYVLQGFSEYFRNCFGQRWCVTAMRLSHGIWKSTTPQVTSKFTSKNNTVRD